MTPELDILLKVTVVLLVVAILPRIRRRREEAFV